MKFVLLLYYRDGIFSELIVLCDDGLIEDFDEFMAQRECKRIQNFDDVVDMIIKVSKNENCTKENYVKTKITKNNFI